MAAGLLLPPVAPLAAMYTTSISTGLAASGAIGIGAAAAGDLANQVHPGSGTPVSMFINLGAGAIAGGMQAAKAAQAAMAGRLAQTGTGFWMGAAQPLLNRLFD